MDKAKLVDELMRDEGLRLFPYEDTVGKLTIGIGRNLKNVGISRAEANYLLDNDIQKIILQLNDRLYWWTTMTENRQRVLVNMCFQLGIEGLLKFNNTLTAMKKGDYETAVKGMKQSIWAKQAPNRAERLAEMMRIG